MRLQIALCMISDWWNLHSGFTGRQAAPQAPEALRSSRHKFQHIPSRRQRPGQEGQAGGGAVPHQPQRTCGVRSESNDLPTRPLSPNERTCWCLNSKP